MSKQHPDDLLNSVNKQAEDRGRLLSAPSADREAEQRVSVLTALLRVQGKKKQQETLENIEKNKHKFPDFLKKEAKEEPVQETNESTEPESDTLTVDEPRKRRFSIRKGK